MPKRIYTIGVYGFTAETFVDRLRTARIDLLVDIRARRGMRGAAHAFANAKRLQRILEEAKVAYRHEPALAPPVELRALQKAVDARKRRLKRDRVLLAPAFIEGYMTLLSTPDARDALARIAGEASRPALLCVEREPGACHRSLVAEALSVEVVHLTP